MDGRNSCLIFAVRFSLSTCRLVGGKEEASGKEGEDFLRSIKLTLVKILVNLQSIKQEKMKQAVSRNRASLLSYITLYVCTCKENMLKKQ